jgi:hypothetical protein
LTSTIGLPHEIGFGETRGGDDRFSAHDGADGGGLTPGRWRCRHASARFADLDSSDGQPCTIVLNPPKAIRPGTNGMSGGIVDFFISAITRLLTAFRWAFDL